MKKALFRSIGVVVVAALGFASCSESNEATGEKEVFVPTVHFVEWLRFQRIEQYFQEHPEELVGERVAVFEELKERQYTEKFKNVCATVISELEK